MKKFFMVTPLQPRTETKDFLRSAIYEPIGNTKLEFRATCFPIMAVINAYAEKDEEIRLIAVMPQTETTPYRIEQLQAELDALQQEKGFICRGVEAVPVKYAGDVATQIEIFHKLLDYMEDDDILYGCLTYGNKTMPIAEMMALQYGYRVLNNVSIGCLVYGEIDHSAEGAPTRIFDITALVQLDEIVRNLADRKVANPKEIIDFVLSL